MKEQNLANLTNLEIVSLATSKNSLTTLEKELLTRLENTLCLNFSEAKNESIILSSNTFLTQKLPANYAYLSNKELYFFIEQHLTENYQYWTEEDVWNQINETADLLVEFLIEYKE